MQNKKKKKSIVIKFKNTAKKRKPKILQKKKTKNIAKNKNTANQKKHHKKQTKTPQKAKKIPKYKKIQKKYKKQKTPQKTKNYKTKNYKKKKKHRKTKKIHNKKIDTLSNRFCHNPSNSIVVSVRHQQITALTVNHHTPWAIGNEQVLQHHLQSFLVHFPPKWKPCHLLSPCECGGCQNQRRTQWLLCPQWGRLDSWISHLCLDHQHNLPFHCQTRSWQPHQEISCELCGFHTHQQKSHHQHQQQRPKDGWRVRLFLFRFGILISHSQPVLLLSHHDSLCECNGYCNQRQ